jgi:hypothetical protein
MREKCKNCARPSKACISYLMTLSTKGMLEWIRIWKERLGWSNATLAEKSHVPKGTIDRILSLAKNESEVVDVKLVTIRPILCALTGCTIEELEACDFSNEATSVDLIEKNKTLQEELKQLKADVKTQSAFLVNQIRIKDRYIAALAISLVAVIILVGIYLSLDFANPNWGLFWAH